MDKIDTFNRYLVSVLPDGRRVRILAAPVPHEVLSPDDALNLAAWLIVLSGATHLQVFAAVDAVRSA